LDLARREEHGEVAFVAPGAVLPIEALTVKRLRGSDGTDSQDQYRGDGDVTHKTSLLINIYQQTFTSSRVDLRDAARWRMTVSP
jgi:hypothetical protein